MPKEATGKTGVPSPTRNKPERPRDRLLADAARVEDGTLVPGEDAVLEPPTV